MQRADSIEHFLSTTAALRRHLAASHGQNKQLPSPAQLGILFTVAQCDAPSIKTIAQSFCMTSSAVTQLVNVLVRDGLLARKAASDDRRKTFITLTRKGKTVVEHAKRERRALFTALLTPLTDNELSTLCTLHDKILDHLRTV